MASTAALAAAFAAPAQAQEAAAPRPVAGDAELVRISADTGSSDIGSPVAIAEPFSDGADVGTFGAIGRTRPGGAPGAYNVPVENLLPPVSPEPQIVISNPGTSTTSRDTGVTGHGQMVVDQQNGFLGLCTGSLINPRTVLFAAHCVNTRAATAYGANSGGVPISFGFQADNLPALQRWFNATFGGQPNALRHQSNPALFLYNVSQVRYNNLSLEPAARGFLYGDIATATLDTPAANVPTWALLFSPLPTPGTATASGTGYNVQIVGYGSHGNAASGSASGSDFRRRTAENIIGALTDLKTFETFIFGSSTSPTQNLYFIDFDDPRRGLTGASPFDFNAFRDNARAREGTPSEGVTAAGDSGGPLIIQTSFAREVIAGVLSGGYTRFFNGQPANGYGTVSFYQPLFLYWDWIAANNPYRYVTNTGGDKLWTDPTNWVTMIDPNYFIIGPNGQLVNGVPNDLGLQKNGTGNGFGEICFESGGRSQCLNVAKNTLTDVMRPIGTEEIATPSDNSGTQRADTINASLTGWVEDIAPEAQADGGATTQALPPATIANGLPGATNFVPNNVDPVRTTGAIGRYFDVSLVANGTTTLNSAVTVDRLTIGGAGARLNIANAGSLTSLIDVRQLAGVLRVDGTLTSRGDYLLAGGGLMGTGRINAPFTTNVMGTITGGTETSIGTLTFGGNLILSAGSQLFVNTGGNDISDLIAVVRSAPGADDGRAIAGGRVTFSRLPGATLRFGDVYTILTAQAGVTGKFTDGVVSFILRPEFIYNTNSVQVKITAVPFTTVVNNGSSVQSSFATLLDQNRGNPALNALFDNLDFAPNAATIQETLENLAPRTETLRNAMGVAGLDNNSRLFRDRVQNMRPGDLGGRMAYYGRRIETAALAASGLTDGTATMSDVAVQSAETQTRLPETMAGFIAAGYLEGENAPMTGTLPVIGSDNFDGFYVAAGLEKELGTSSAIGFALSYTDIEGETVVGGQSADGQFYLGTLYGKAALDRSGVVMVDGQISVGQFDLETLRPGNLPGQPFTLRSDTSSLAAAAEIGIGAMFGKQVRFGPRFAARASTIDFGRTTETGGPTALQIERNDYNSVQGRAGLVVEGAGRIRPNLTATYVHEFDDGVTGFGANFVGGIGGNVGFNLAGLDSDWFEVAGGLTVETGKMELSVSADTTIERDDVENRSYRAAIKLRF
jgi:hypothetical protein